MFYCALCEKQRQPFHIICSLCEANLIKARVHLYPRDRPSHIFAYTPEIQRMLHVLRSSYSPVWARLLYRLASPRMLLELLIRNEINLITVVPTKLRGIANFSIASPMKPFLLHLSRKTNIPFQDHLLRKDQSHSQHTR